MHKSISDFTKKKTNWVYTIIATGFVFIVFNACNEGISNPLWDLIEPDALTADDITIMHISVPSSSPEIFPYKVAKYSEFGYGFCRCGAGLPYEKRTDLLPTNYNAASVINMSRFLNFFAKSDIHIMDKKTPAQATYFDFKGNNSSANSATMLYTTQVLYAAIRTINALDKKNQLDFGIFLGDNTNRNQYNELRWFIAILDDKIINPGSCLDDNHINSPNNYYQDEFYSEGLYQNIPWYQILGNQEHVWLGIYPTNSYLQQFYIGEYIIDMGDILINPQAIGNRGFYCGAIVGQTPYKYIIGADQVGDFTLSTKVNAADPNRRFLSKEEWMCEFFNSSTKPSVHGFNQQSGILGCYSFEPKKDLPIKVIVLDDTQKENDFDIHENGYINNERYNWLII